jgi:predicted ferric reductase
LDLYLAPVRRELPTVLDGNRHPRLLSPILVTVTFYIRSRISMKSFRAIHYLSIVAYVGALLHGLYAGTDSYLSWTQVMYWGTFLSTAFFGVFWLFIARLNKRENSDSQIRTLEA